MKRAAIYARVSTADQHLETQLYDLRKLASQKGFEVTREYCDRGISGSKARRPGLDALMADARRREGEFSIVLVAAFDRIARSTKNFLENRGRTRTGAWNRVLLWRGKPSTPAVRWAGCSSRLSGRLLNWNGR